MPADNAIAALEIDLASAGAPAESRRQVQCQIVTQFADLERLASEWDRLWRTDPEGEVFQSFAWNRAWWRANSHSCELCTPVVWYGSEVAAILPLVRRGGRIQFMAVPEADYGDILCEERDTAQCLAAAIDALFQMKHWNECVLEHLSCNSRVARHWKQLQSVRDYLAVIPASPCPTVLLEKESGLLRKLADKKHLRRHETKLQKTAPVKFNLLRSREEIEKCLPDFVRQQILRRELLAEESSCLRPEFTALLNALAEESELQKYLRFFVLEWDGRPLAYHLGFEANGKFTMYQQTFNVDAWDYSAGEVLMRQLFLYAADRVTREFDFSVGEEFYKSRFANHFKPNFTAYIERPSIQGRVRRVGRKAQGKLVGPATKLKQAIRGWSKAYRAAKYSRSWITESSALLRRQPEAGAKIEAAAAEVQVKEAQLADLAELHLECPRFRLATKLGTFKQRLRDEEKAYIVRRCGRPALLAWARKPSAGANINDLIYDCAFLDKDGRVTAYGALEAFLGNLR